MAVITHNNPEINRDKSILSHNRKCACVHSIDQTPICFSRRTCIPHNRSIEQRCQAGRPYILNNDSDGKVSSMLKYGIGRFATYILSLTIILGTISLQACSAQTVAETDTSTIRHVISSHYPDQDRVFDVRLPPSYYDRPEHRYPVIYILDGDQNLELTEAVVSTLVDAEKMPEVIIVGLHAGRTRGRDYRADISNPTSDVGAKRFLEHIEKELLPYVDSRYRTSSFRVLSGHSWGALFTTFALTEKPVLFDAFLAQSPNLRRKWTPYFIARIEEHFRHVPDLETTYVMTLGNERKSVPGFNQLTAVFQDKAPETFRWQATRQDGASHMETREPGMREGLTYIFRSD